MVTTRPPKTIVEPTALGTVANTDSKLLIYRLFQKGRVLAQDGIGIPAHELDVTDALEESFCSASRITEPVPRRLVPENFENTSTTPACGAVRVFGHDAIDVRVGACQTKTGKPLCYLGCFRSQVLAAAA